MRLGTIKHQPDYSKITFLLKKILLEAEVPGGKYWSGPKEFQGQDQDFDALEVSKDIEPT